MNKTSNLIIARKVIKQVTNYRKEVKINLNTKQ